MINKANKKIGIIAILVVILMVCLFTYLKSGKDKLVKNDNTSIFVEEENQDSYENEEKIKDKNIVVEIKGEVKTPDVYELNDESIVKDVIEIAGGLTEEADISNINRAQKLKNHELIYIHNKNEVKENLSYSQNTVTKSDSSGKININCAQLEELKNLNGIGEAKAKRIIEYSFQI